MSYFCKMKRHGLDSTSWCKSQAVKVHDKLQQGKAWLTRIYLSVRKSSPVAVCMHSVYAKLCVVSIYSFPYSHLEFSFCWICSHSLFLLSVTWKFVIPTVYPKEQDNILDPLIFLIFFAVGCLGVMVYIRVGIGTDLNLPVYVNK